jgi:hypothetical protein
MPCTDVPAVAPGSIVGIGRGEDVEMLSSPAWLVEGAGLAAR